MPAPLLRFTAVALLFGAIAARAAGAPPLPPDRALVDFVGARSFSENELFAAIAREIADFKESGLTPARGDDTAYYLATFYRKKGFAKVRVDYEIRGRRLVLKIDEGPRTLLREVNFVGNRSIPAATLYDYMLGATPDRLAKEADMFPYNESEIAAGVDRVRGLYISEGFLNAVVEARPAEFSRDGTRARITIQIQEKLRYTFGDVTFSGDLLFTRAQLEKAMGEPINGPFSASKANNAQRNLQSYYKTHGYYQADVVVAADPAQAPGGRVPVHFTIKSGPLFRFDGVTVTGLDRLKPSFLPKRFAHLRGEIYDPAKLDETFREMLRTGLFKNLRMSLTPIAGNELRIDLGVEEAKAREVGFNIGAGSYEGVSVGLRLADRNLFGNGRPLTFSLQSSQRGLQGELLYVDPWLFDSRFGLRARIYSSSRDEEGYGKDNIGWRIDLTRRVLPHLELGLFVEQQNANITVKEIDETLLGPTNYFLSSVGLTGSVDYRSDPINPARGFILTGALDFSTLDGEPAFTRATGRFSYYLPLGKNVLLALGARGGLIEPNNNATDIPIDVRYFNGGGTTVRSFAERKLGPKDRSGHPLGGEMFTVFNAEATFPIVGALLGAVFLDAGNVKTSLDSDMSDLRYAVGLGLRYKLPIGPLRLDYGLNPAPRGDEARGAFHFSFGFAF
jgi:outer membrane protein assembly complex protein YaeT